MDTIQNLITDNLHIWSTALDEKKSGRGRGSNNKNKIYGIKKLRELILDLAVRGKLVPQDSSDEPASELLKRIQDEKQKLIAEGKLKKEKPLPPIIEDEKPFNLPTGWEWVRLVALTSLITKGSSPKWQGIDYTDSPDGVMFVTSENVGKYELLLSSPKYVEKTFNEIEPRSILNFGDFLMNIVGASIGRTAIYNKYEIANINQAVCLIRVIGDHLVDQFLLHFFNSETCLNYMFDKQVDNARPNLSMGNISQFVIPLPPLAEQHRIVAKVDELMKICDDLEEGIIKSFEVHDQLVETLLNNLCSSKNSDDFNSTWQIIYENFETLFTTEESIEKLKQSILQLAIMGKLVPQYPNDEPASELLKRIQDEKQKLISEGKIKKEKPLPPITEDEKPFNLPNGWEATNIGKVIVSLLSGGTPSKANSNYWGGDIPWASVKDLNVDLYLERTQDFITEEGLKAGSKLANTGDIIICTRMGLGKIAISKRPIAINQDLKAVKLSSYVSPLFFILFYKTIEIIGKGTTVDGLKQEILLNYQFLLPPLAEQHRIVMKVDELMKLCDDLKSKITTANQTKITLANTISQNLGG